jgi:hypothetical protein
MSEEHNGDVKTTVKALTMAARIPIGFTKYKVCGHSMRAAATKLPITSTIK